jgi:hypothetical protein
MSLDMEDLTHPCLSRCTCIEILIAYVTSRTYVVNEVLHMIKLQRAERGVLHQLHELGPTMVTPLSAPWNFPCERPGRRDGVPIPVLFSAEQTSDLRIHFK